MPFNTNLIFYQNSLKNLEGKIFVKFPWSGEENLCVLIEYSFIQSVDIIAYLQWVENIPSTNYIYSLPLLCTSKIPPNWSHTCKWATLGNIGKHINIQKIIMKNGLRWSCAKVQDNLSGNQENVRGRGSISEVSFEVWVYISNIRNRHSKQRESRCKKLAKDGV